MSDPYALFNLEPSATQAEIRQRYLELVRQSPPDRDPERFAKIRAAYDELCDPVRSLERQLFSTISTDSFESLSTDVQRRIRAARLPMDVVLSLAERE